MLALVNVVYIVCLVPCVNYIDLVDGGADDTPKSMGVSDTVEPHDTEVQEVLEVVGGVRKRSSLNNRLPPESDTDMSYLKFLRCF